jgi:hypothetical protein
MLTALLGIVRAYGLTIPENTAITVSGGGCAPGVEVEIVGGGRPCERQ